MFRKIIIIFIAAAMITGLCGCTLVSRVDARTAAPEKAKFEPEHLHVPVPVEPEPVPEENGAAEGEGEEPVAEAQPVDEYPQIKEDDPMYGDVSEMLKGLVPVFSYFAFKGEDMDLSDLSADDFWLLMAMISAQANADHKDADGSVSLRKEVLNDYAASFFGDYFMAHGLPDWKGTVSASAEPRSQVISLSAMAVDGYHGRLAGFEASPDQDGMYDLYLEVYWSVIEGAQTGNDISEALLWKIVLDPWPEGSEHAFAFRMKSFERIEREVPEKDAPAEGEVQPETEESSEVTAD